MSSSPSSSTAAETASPTSTDEESSPRRFIYDERDMVAFKTSPAKLELIRLVRAMGKSCATAEEYTYDSQVPLEGLNPAMASLHGSLRCMDGWLKSIPPNTDAQVRFGNPAFRTWHARLAKRSRSIVKCLLDCHERHDTECKLEYDSSLLEQCADDGFRAASREQDDTEEENVQTSIEGHNNNNSLLIELTTYLHDSFGHPMRLDYGTGHESSFFVFLYSLCKIGCFGSTLDKAPPTALRLKAITLSVTTQYLKITRGLQTDYMLEPAGSHGVWGLDDYHCLPFYFGACQLASVSNEEYKPDAIRDSSNLQHLSEKFMYFGCIRYITTLKKGVPFSESSSMLNDISYLPNWKKVSEGLLRLYEGEVLDKRQVVQHFMFGKIFEATWTTSHQPREVPASGQTFRDVPTSFHSSQQNTSRAAPGGNGMPPTKAPWAK